MPNKKKQNDEPIDIDDVKMPARGSRSGERKCKNCGISYFIKEGLDDDFCSQECADEDEEDD